MKNVGYAASKTSEEAGLKTSENARVKTSKIVLMPEIAPPEIVKTARLYFAQNAGSMTYEGVAPKETDKKRGVR